MEQNILGDKFDGTIDENESPSPEIDLPIVYPMAALFHA